MQQLLLFDFDGTVADSLHQGLAHYNALAEEHGFLPIRNVEAARQMKTKEFFRSHNIPLRRLPRLYRKFVDLQNEGMPRIRLVDGMADVLGSLVERYQLGILSSNSEENIRACLEANHVEHLFDFIQSHNRLFGKHKSLRKIRRRLGYASNEIVYIGDEARDAQGSAKAGIDFCAVGWGLHPAEVLLAENPRYFVHRPDELLDLFTAPSVVDTLPPVCSA